jgi:hypothetical protein
MTTTNAWGFDDFPGVDETEMFQGLESHLTGAEAGEEEFFDLERVQVAIVVENLEDEQVALVEASMQSIELSLRRTSFALRRKVSELSSGGLRSVLRFLRRRPQRIPRSEGRSELELIADVIRVVLERA